jgi:hypothetical protein
MTAKPEAKPKLKRPPSLPSLTLWFVSGLMLVALVPFGSWFLKRGQQSLASDPRFEQIYPTVLQLSQAEVKSPLGSRYGIRQLDYDAWRQLNGKPVEDLANIQESEIKAMYLERWQQANCQQYTAPLDVTCLDSMVSFGRQANQLLANLPANPEQAALEVVSRREELRRRQLRPPLTPSKRLVLREGLDRDRALADLIVSGTIAQSGAPVPAVPPASTSTPLPNGSAPVPNSTAELSADQIYQQLKPSTVEVWNVQNGVASTASGVILSPNGLVLTNRHVVQANPRPSVKLADGRQFDGSVMSIDDSLDLALIQLRGANNLPTVPFAPNTTNVQVGDQVYAIGSPRGESWKMSQTQVIELNSTCANGASPLRCIRTPSGFLQPGNSGGPLINAQGQVIGLNRAVQQSTGEGVSIPVETIQSFLAQRTGQLQSEPANPYPAPFRFLPRLSQPKGWL